MIDRGDSNYAGALATLTVLDSAHAVILTHPDMSLPIAPGQRGYVYRGVDIGRVIKKLTAGGPTELTASESRSTQNPASAVEQALADSLPSLLFVGTRDAPHWVLATGWRPAFAGSAEARGTYDIVNPADPSGPTTLWATYGNRFGGAWVVRRVPGSQPELAAKEPFTPTQSSSSQLTLWLTGDASLALTGPGGQSLTYDPATDDYLTNIPGAVAVRSAHPGNAADPASDDVPADLIVLPTSGPAQYSLTVLASADGPVSLTGSHDVDGAYAGHDAARAVLADGGRGYFNLSVSPGSVRPVSLQLTATVGVREGAVPSSLRLRVVPSPTTSLSRILFDTPLGGAVRVEIFDVSGRRVRKLVDGAIPAGSHVTTWDGRDDEGAVLGAGLYFVRGQVAGQSRVVRCVRLASGGGTR